MHLVSRMPDLEVVIFTGDKRQLGVHLKDIPELFHVGYGLESVIEQVEISPGVHYTYLTKMYRSHPTLVQLDPTPRRFFEHDSRGFIASKAI